ncbi:hypothetical protein [Echinicola rosea]|nr:hypothetical protein [Echinicola rosea]
MSWVISLARIDIVVNNFGVFEVTEFEDISTGVAAVVTQTAVVNKL